MSLISFTPLADGSTGVIASATNTPLSTIYNDYNGNITDANISASAAIAISKVSTDALLPQLKNPYKFSATGNTTALAGSTTAVANYTTTTFDTGTNFSKTTGLFTAPITGFYWFNFEVDIGSSNGVSNVGKMFIHKNGADVRTIITWVAPAVTGTLGGSAGFFLSLTAADTVGVNGLATSGGGSLTNANFEGFLVSKT